MYSMCTLYVYVYTVYMNVRTLFVKYFDINDTKWDNKDKTN